jgi:hypothetical protein
MRSSFGAGQTNLRTFSYAGGAGGGEGTARTLRTTQWTRASFELIFGSAHIDDLKDH